MKGLLFTITLLALQTYSFSQDWHRNDFHFSLMDSINGEMITLTPETIEEYNYQLYTLTSSFSGIRKFYYDESLSKFRIVSEVMEGTEDPYLIIVKADTLMGILLIPQTAQSNTHKILIFNKIHYTPGLFKISSWQNSGKTAPIYNKDDQNQPAMDASIMKNPEIQKDQSKTLKQIDKSYAYAYPFMGIKQNKPEGTKVYKLDIF